MQYVWYAAYGSNLSSERLSKYLEGGQARGAVVASAGARNPSPPTHTDAMVIDHQLCFGYVSTTWGGGGIAFLSPAAVPGSQCMLRLHRVTANQFADIYSQENRSKGSVQIDLKLLQESRSVDLLPSLYGRLLHLGSHPGTSEPVVSFTSSKTEVPNVPSVAYLRTISVGLVEAFGLGESEIIAYLSSASGMEDWQESNWPLVIES